LHFPHLEALNLVTYIGLRQGGYVELSPFVPIVLVTRLSASKCDV